MALAGALHIAYFVSYPPAQSGFEAPHKNACTHGAWVLFSRKHSSAFKLAEALVPRPSQTSRGTFKSPAYRDKAGKWHGWCGTRAGDVREHGRFAEIKPTLWSRPMCPPGKRVRTGGLRVAIVGCGRMGAKRARALTPGDALVACYDVNTRAATCLGRRYGAKVCTTAQDLLATAPQVVIIATSHEHLAEFAEQALMAGAHVLVEKPAGMSTAQIDRLNECQQSSGRLLKVGFNHRFHPAISRILTEVHSGEHGELMHLRGRYGHGGRLGYEREWRADPARAGGGELVDQGMHLLDLTHWLAGPLPLHAALLRTQFWEAPVEDNAVLVLGEPETRTGPWAMLHVSWTEWKNLFSLEVYCRNAKLQVDGLGGSYGPQRLQIHRMGADLGPPEIEEVHYPDEDRSWRSEWEHFTEAIALADERSLLGTLADAHYAWTQVESAYAMGPYAEMRAARMPSQTHATRVPSQTRASLPPSQMQVSFSPSHTRAADMPSPYAGDRA